MELVIRFRYIVKNLRAPGSSWEASEKPVLESESRYIRSRVSLGFCGLAPFRLICWWCLVCSLTKNKKTKKNQNITKWTNHSFFRRSSKADAATLTFCQMGKLNQLMKIQSDYVSAMIHVSNPLINIYALGNPLWAAHLLWEATPSFRFPQTFMQAYTYT